MRHKAKLALLLCALLLGAVFALAACGKEEKATPTKAPAATAAAPAATPTKAAAATTPAASPAVSPAAASPTAAAAQEAWNNPKKYGQKLVSYLEKYHPNKMDPEKNLTPKYGGVINFSGGVTEALTGWDPINDPGWTFRFDGKLIWSSFTRLANNRGDNLLYTQPKGDMMESWQQSGDGLTWTWKMRKGMKWQNLPPVNGRAITIQDMKYGFDLLVGSPVTKKDLEAIQSVDIVDDTTLKVTLKRPMPDLARYLGGTGGIIVAKECHENETCRKSKPVGSGPFMLDQHEPKVKQTLKKNPDYWGTDAKGGKLPYLDGVSRIVFSDAAAILAALRTGKIDNDQLLGEIDLKDLLKSQPKLVVALAGPIQDGILHGNEIQFKWETGKPWMDPKVRLAMNLATPRRSMIDDGFDGLAVPLQPVPFYQLGLPYYPAQEDLGLAWQYDPAKAKTLLAEAGYAKGFKAKLYGVAASGANGNALLIWQKAWKDVGIELELQLATDSAEYWGKWRAKTYDDLIYQSTMNPTNTRAFIRAYDTLHSKGISNLSGINDPKLDELLDKANITVDEKERAKVLKQVLDYEAENPHIVYGPAPFHFDVYQPWVHAMGAGDGYYAAQFSASGITNVWVDPH